MRESELMFASQEGKAVAVSPQLTEVANYFIWRVASTEELQGFGDNITNLKLQKLVYYAQGFCLAITDEPLFPDPIEAWMHGPVVPDLYFRYQPYGATPLATPDDFDPTRIDGETRQLLEDVFSVYGQYSAWGLRNLTHEEAPWKDTPQGKVISTKRMRDYFQTQLVDAEEA